MSKRLEPKVVSRRDFLSLTGLWAAGVAIIGSLAGMLRLVNPRLSPEASSTFRIGRPEEFPPGTARIISDRNIQIIAGSGGVAAMSLVCTHLGCIVKGTEEGFSCPCHGSRFGPIGEVLSGPAPRGLRWFEISRAADGRLVVDAKREVVAGTFYQV